jgi:hypothetical protein
VYFQRSRTAPSDRSAREASSPLPVTPYPVRRPDRCRTEHSVTYGRLPGDVMQSTCEGVGFCWLDRKRLANKPATSDQYGYQFATNPVLAIKKGLTAVCCKSFFSTRCERQDLNLHAFRLWILSPARLPIPPLSHDHLKHCLKTGCSDSQDCISGENRHLSLILSLERG